MRFAGRQDFSTSAPGGAYVKPVTISENLRHQRYLRAVDPRASTSTNHQELPPNEDDKLAKGECPVNFSWTRQSIEVAVNKVE
jgi:hypothetical protein